MTTAIPLSQSVPPSRWQVFTAAPHRVMFFFGVLQSVFTMAWWLIDLTGRYLGWFSPIAWAVPAVWGHAYLMIYTLFPFFIFGFLMTAMPNWLGDVRVRRWEYVATGLTMAAGVAVSYAGLVAGPRWMALGVALHLAGWAVGLTTLFRIVRGSAAGQKGFSALFLAELSLGWLGAAAFLAWLLGADVRSAMVSRYAGLWLFLLPVFLTVSHRMIPFFSSRVLENYVVFRPEWSLPFLLAGCAVHGALEFSGAYAWLWLADGPMCLWIGYLALRWGLTQSFRARLLAVLHLALVALTLALFFYAAQSAALALGYPGFFGLVPLHVLTIGYFAAITVGMVSRVSLGHSGRALVADNLTWRCFQGVLVTAALRAAAELPGVAGSAGPYLIVAAAVAWLASFLPWAWRYAPIYWQPRGDRRAG